VKPILFFYLALLFLTPILYGCATKKEKYENFAQWPGFEEYYADRCRETEAIVGPMRTSPYMETTPEEKRLLATYRPRFVIPPGGYLPIDFYRDYLPFTTLREYPGGELVHGEVTPHILGQYQRNTRYYLEFSFDRFVQAGLHRTLNGDTGGSISPEQLPAVYGRVYREMVYFPGDGGVEIALDLTFLKYNIVFAISGLSARIPALYKPLLKLAGLDPGNWHDLDNFVAVHVVLLNNEVPIAIILAQHNHHRAYLIGKDVQIPEDKRLLFDIALMSNEVYLASSDAKPVRHRTIRWSLELKYLLSGEDPPLARGYDMTYGVNAGGREVEYALQFLSPCDPFYTAEIILGEPRPFMGRYIGRDGPPGADYYQLPELLPLGNILKFYYLEDDKPDDIAAVDRFIDRDKKLIDTPALMEYGGKKFLRDLREDYPGLYSNE
jgi:hypothetical protein